MLETFTVDTFAPLVGSAFVVHVADGPELDCELVEARRLVGKGATRDPFAIVLLGPLEPMVTQGTYRIDHRELGAFDLFVVPIGRDERGTSYEAIFT